MNNKKVINAVAGSGKTTLIIDRLDLKKKTLILTYTTENQNHLKKKIIQKFGSFPNNIFVFGYFEFLLNFIVKPLSPYSIKNICYEKPNPRNPSPFNKNKDLIYSNRIARYILNHLPEFKNRMEKYFDEILIDEMQDLASDDFMWMMSLSKLNIPVMLVGDFYQSTFSSSIRGNHLKNLYKDFLSYREIVESFGYEFDTELLVKSRRCTITACDFVKKNLNILIESDKQETSRVELITKPQEIEQVLVNSEIKKLFYMNSHKYQLNAGNWGGTKGMTYENICVVLNETTYKHYQSNSLHELNPQTKSKFYVACTRSLNDVLFIREKDIPKKYKM